MKSLLLLIPLLVLAGCTPPANNTATPNPPTVEVQAEASDKFEAYSPANFDTLQANEESVVIFFHANWCSWCRAREKEILENLNTLPENTRILKADFDKANELKKKYGVTQQDTFIFVDGTGEVTLKNGSSVETIEKFFAENTVTPGEERPAGLGGYFDYDPMVVDTFKGRKAYALFFHANWCPSCVAEDKMLTAEIQNFPKNTNIFKTNYDKETELRKEYGVTGQHTYVFFDKEGNYVETKRGVTKDDLIAYFQ